MKQIIRSFVEFGFSKRIRIWTLNSVEFGTELFGQEQIQTKLKRTEFKFVRDYHLQQCFLAFWSSQYSTQISEKEFVGTPKNDQNDEIALLFYTF